jgi:uncharacterized phage-associated protein
MLMNELAQHIIAVANDNNLSVTNLKLQKILYFSLQIAVEEKIYKKEDLEKIYDCPFRVWRYGPVVQEIYDNYRIYGANPIIEDESEIILFQPLNSIIVSLLHEKPFDLVNKSHKERFWIENKEHIIGWRSNIKYSLKDIIKDV